MNTQQGLVNMNTLKIESLWYEGEYTMVYVIDWDFDVWVEYGTFKVKGSYTYAGILDMIVHDSDLLEYVE